MTPPAAEKVAEPFTEALKLVEQLLIGQDYGRAAPSKYDADRAREIVRGVRRKLAAAPAPSVAQSEREAFEREASRIGLSLQKHVKDVGPFRVGDYADGRTKSAFHFWQARASAGSARGEVQRRVPGGPACPTCGFRINIKAKPPLMVDDNETEIAAHTHIAPPALTEGLSAEELRRCAEIKRNIRGAEGWVRDSVRDLFVMLRRLGLTS